MELNVMSGTGNTFVFVNMITESEQNQLQSHFPGKNLSQISIILCAHPNIDTDGAVFIFPSQTSDFRWEFYNRDGSLAEMCGNAARCASRFAYDNKLSKLQTSFETLAGTINGEILAGLQVKVSMPKISKFESQKEIKNSRFFAKYDFLDTGVPHCVIKVPSLANLNDIRPLAVELRRKEYFQPTGANITFRVPYSPSHLESITFERGVEDFTLACGTGAVAAAYSHYMEHKATPSIQVSVPGGELQVDLGGENPILIGEVKYIKKLKPEELEGDLV